MYNHILRIDSSARFEESVSRLLATELIDRLEPNRVTTRDLVDGVPLLEPVAIAGMSMSREKIDKAHGEALAFGQTLIDELEVSDALVIAMPIYNFGPPAALKAWADQVARSGITFRYTEAGPIGLVADRPTYVVVASGGVPVTSTMDWATGWITQFLNFLGITSITVIDAGQLNSAFDEKLSAARDHIDSLARQAA